MTVYEILNKIQVELKAPKNQQNKFGNYNYRSCEDILEAVKPHLAGSVVTISDEIELVGMRFYIKATITITYDGQSISCSAYAREDESQKGMSASQLTGSTSSYARKYSANGLFLIDDTKDADTMDNTKKDKKQPETHEVAPQAPEDDIPDFITPSQLAIVDGYLKKLDITRPGLGRWLVTKKKLSEPDITKLTQKDATAMVRAWDDFSADIKMYSLNMEGREKANA